MTKQYKLSLHIFRRDLRLQDNSALIEALTLSESVIPCFIFDDRQIKQNPYCGNHALEFMYHSLAELNHALINKNSKLYFFCGNTEDIIAKLLKEHAIQAVFINRDYTPFSRKRDHAIEQHCKQHGVDFHVYADALLHEPEQVLKKDGKPYTVFTPAFRYSSTLPVEKPRKNTFNHYHNQPITLECDKTFKKLSQLNQSTLRVKGGRSEGLRLLKEISRLQNYHDQRNFPALDATSHLSAHHKFGTISIRETYWQIIALFGKQHTLINELYWRDFFTHIAFHFPHVFGSPFHTKYAALPWQKNEAAFQAWCRGETGFPIVDAGMRELNTTGYMHNRVRMITASFLTKDLHINWLEGEQYFAQQLVDYDPAVNNGNWQWAASTGCDAQPYFRIFNPWLQQQKFDPECEYIKRWIPELKDLPAKSIHQQHTDQLCINYPKPIVDHSRASQMTKLLYKKIAQ